MYVELDIFSGRPNPRWETAAADDARIITSISRLSRIAEERARVDRLGYRGFVVTDEQCRAFQRLWVFGSAVEILTASGVTTYRDADRSLERTLVELARRQLPDEVYEVLVTNLGDR